MVSVLARIFLPNNSLCRLALEDLSQVLAVRGDDVLDSLLGDQVQRLLDQVKERFSGERLLVQ